MSKILILGGDADCNVGDTAILAATCHSLVRTQRSAEITIVSRIRQPGEFPGLVDVIAPGPAGFLRLLASARRADRVIFGGGGLIQDDDSRAKVPYWAARLAAVRQVQPNIVGHCLGAGPLEHADSRQFARAICGMLNGISVRDEFARSWLQRCTAHPVDVVPDPAFMLPPAPRASAVQLMRSVGLAPERPTIGVAIRGWFHRRGGFVPRKIRTRFGFGNTGSNAAMERFLDDLAAELRLLARRLDAAILFLPSYGVSHEGDIRACRALEARLAQVTAATAVLKDPHLYKAVAGGLTLMVAARMHPLILAASLGAPIVGLGYNGKFTGLHELLGLGQCFAQLDDLHESLGTGWLQSLASAALEDRTDLRHRCALLGEKVHHCTGLLLQETGLRPACE
jgi:polysaccharide pyruvyl transferase WcaK-like protein